MNGRNTLFFNFLYTLLLKCVFSVYVLKKNRVKFYCRTAPTRAHEAGIYSETYILYDHFFLLNAGREILAEKITRFFNIYIYEYKSDLRIKRWKQSKPTRTCDLINNLPGIYKERAHIIYKLSMRVIIFKTQIQESRLLTFCIG